MNYKMLKANDIQKSPYNPRIDLTPDDPAFHKIAKSLSEFGCVEPIIVNEYNNRCVGGHQRLSVMRYLGYEEIPCVFINEPDEMKEKALNITLNKIDNKFDENKLAALLEELDSLDVDMSVTGFNINEIEELLAQVDVEDADYSEEPQEEEYEAANILCKVGIYNFKLERQKYIDAVNQIRVVAGFEEKDIINEFKRRLRND